MPASLSSPPVLLHVVCESGLSLERLGPAESVGLLQALAPVMHESVDRLAGR